MTIDIENQKIRTPVVWFAVFMSLMLFQTNYLRLGMITALVSIGMIILTGMLNGCIDVKCFKISKESIVLFLFLVLTSIVSFGNYGMPTYYTKYAAQIILCIFLQNIELSHRENEFLKWTFCISSAVYALLVIKASSLGHTHARIILFNTSFDPNFIGIPFTAASIILLDNILQKTKRVFSLALYFIIAVAIIATASRGNLVSWILGSTLLFVYYIFRSNFPIWKKLLTFMIIGLFIYILSSIIAAQFSSAWIRMTNFGEDADNGRFELWNRAFQMWENKPILGVGLQGMMQENGSATHNTFIQLIAETGILGSLLFVLFVFFILMKVWKIEWMYVCVLFEMLLQIAFLDALDNRCVWVVFCWFIMLPQNNSNIKERDLAIK